jgi:hypothetical protein
VCCLPRASKIALARVVCFREARLIFYPLAVHASFNRMIRRFLPMLISPRKWYLIILFLTFGVFEVVYIKQSNYTGADCNLFVHLQLCIVPREKHIYYIHASECLKLLHDKMDWLWRCNILSGRIFSVCADDASAWQSYLFLFCQLAYLLCMLQQAHWRWVVSAHYVSMSWGSLSDYVLEFCVISWWRPCMRTFRFG